MGKGKKKSQSVNKKNNKKEEVDKTEKESTKIRSKTKDIKKEKETQKIKESKKGKGKKAKTEEPVVSPPKKVITSVAKVDMYVPSASSYKVLENINKKDKYDSPFWTCTLNKSDVIKNNNKFYVIQILVSNSNPSNLMLFTRWGRVGVPGQQGIQNFINEEQAIKAFISKYKSKTNEGYIKVEIDYNVEEVEEESEKMEEEKEETPCTLSEPVINLIKMIFDVGRMNKQLELIGYDIKKMPLGKLAKDSIQKGYEVLSKIEDAIKKKKDNELPQLSSEFYSLIPHDFGFKKMINFIITDLDTVKRKIEMLDSLEKMSITTKIIKNSSEVQSQYDSLNCNIRTVDPNEKIYNILKDYLEISKTNDPNICGYGPKNASLIEAFEVEKNGEKEKFQDLGNKRLLWHGSRITNFVGILSQGLRIAPPEAPSSGYVYGKGLYFADMSEKSMCYCYPGPDRIALIFLVEVSLGKIEERQHGDCSLPKTMKKESNSIKGIGEYEPSEGITVEDNLFIPNGKIKVNNSGFSPYNEFIVYDTNQVKLRYILKIRID